MMGVSSRSITKLHSGGRGLQIAILQFGWKVEGLNPFSALNETIIDSTFSLCFLCRTIDAKNVAFMCI